MVGVGDGWRGGRSAGGMVDGGSAWGMVSRRELAVGTQGATFCKPHDK